MKYNKHIECQVKDRYDIWNARFFFKDEESWHVMSLLDPDDKFNKEMTETMKVMLGDRYSHHFFEDTENCGGTKPCTIEHVDIIYDWMVNTDFTNKGVFIHCHAGISRSTATAIAFHVVVNGMSPEDAVETVFKGRPIMFPNTLITELFDKKLGLNGSLIKAVALKKDYIIMQDRKNNGIIF